MNRFLLSLFSIATFGLAANAQLSDRFAPPAKTDPVPVVTPKPTPKEEPKPYTTYKVETPAPMDKAKLPAQRDIVLSWKKDFPKLGEDFEVWGAGTASPRTTATIAGLDSRGGVGSATPGTYNCIAHSAGIKNIWVNPYQTWEGWDLYYNPLGYKKTRNVDTSYVPGIQKIAVYATKKDGYLTFQHAAVQEKDGTWSSKLGSGPLIRHRNADSVSGPSYGEVVAVFSREFGSTTPVVPDKIVELPKNPKADVAKFRGTWEIVKAEAGGQPAALAMWTFDGDRMTSRGMKETGPGTVWELKFDATRAIKEIDIGSYKGIYKFEGDTLTICYSLSGNRPTEFNSKNGWYFNVLKREAGFVKPAVVQAGVVGKWKQTGSDSVWTFKNDGTAELDHGGGTIVRASYILRNAKDGQEIDWTLTDYKLDFIGSIKVVGDNLTFVVRSKEGGTRPTQFVKGEGYEHYSFTRAGVANTIVGKWKQVGSDSVWTFKNDGTAELDHGGGSIVKAAYVLRNAKDGQEIDWTLTDGNWDFIGSIKVDSDNLTFVVRSKGSGARPTQFVKGEGYEYYSFTRTK